MNETRRPTLRKGSRIAIVSPASAAKPELIERGCGNLRAFGYEPVITPHALSHGPLYYAGTTAERVADIHAAFADPSIDGIFCTRGGWGSAELLPLLDVALIRSNRKVFVGYSDHTSLHTWLWNECSLETFYAPMVAADWSKDDGIDERTWRAALHAEGHWDIGARDGLRILQPGEATGRLLGGCLSILTAGLGTPWAIRIDEPCILFLEDIHTKPYQWDRMLQQLSFAGIMDHVTGIVFGDMSANIEPSETPLLEAACLHALRNFTGPIALGLKSGHVQQDNRSMPLGIRVKMANEEVSELSSE